MNALLLVAMFCMPASARPHPEGETRPIGALDHEREAKLSERRRRAEERSGIKAPARPSAEEASARKAAFAARLEQRYGVTLIEKRLRCPCVAYAVLEDGIPVGVVEGRLMGRTPEETESELEGALRGVLGLPPLAEGQPDVVVDPVAREIMRTHGVTLVGAILSTSGHRVNLNVDGNTAQVSIQAGADADTVVVSAVNKDGSSGGAIRIVRGKIAP